MQGTLQEALATVLRCDVPLQGAGRTDAGVHALGQTASFECNTDIKPERLARSLSGIAGPEISVVEAAVAPQGFNARFDSTGKHYRYQIISRRSPSPLNRRTAHFVPQDLDLESMHQAAAQLVGEHDFAGFRAADCERENTIRTLSEVSVKPGASGWITIDVKGTAFLKNMVRVIAGTLIDIGKGRLPSDTVARVLETGDRTLAGPTAPANGLTLVEVFYPQGWIRERPLS